jgi:hypothetical protein
MPSELERAATYLLRRKPLAILAPAGQLLAARRLGAMASVSAETWVAGGISVAEGACEVSGWRVAGACDLPFLF